MNKIIDGKKISQDILEDLKEKISKIGQNKIGIAFVLVGDNPASKTYVKMKKKACQKLGIQSYPLELKETISENDLLIEIDKLNKNNAIHGILVQMPLPSHINEKKIIYSIDPNKDVDGFHPINIGKLMLGEQNIFFPCTPYGIKVLMEKENIEIEKKHVVILGRSNIVGKPLLNILIQNKKGCNATVTLVHSKTNDIKKYTLLADILICAIGNPLFIKQDMIKKDSIIIDVGINKIYDKEQSKIVGDVDFNDVFEKVKKITPVPGGVGPMTIAMLMENSYKSFIKKFSL